MSDEPEAICKRKGEHILSMGAASMSEGSTCSCLSQGRASRTKLPRPMQQRLGIHASQGRSDERETREPGPTYAYIWWCSGDRLDGSIVPKDTRFCMSRSSTFSSM